MAAARLRRPRLDRAVAGFSRLGDSGVGWVALGVVVAAAQRRPGTAVAVAGTVWGTLAANYAVKLAVRRERPDLAAAPRAIAAPSSTSFPSAHAAMSAAAAIALGDAVPAARLPVRVASLAMAWSRVHLGVHHPSDVVAGYALGTGTGLVARRLRAARRRADR